MKKQGKGIYPTVSVLRTHMMFFTKTKREEKRTVVAAASSDEHVLMGWRSCSELRSACTHKHTKGKGRSADTGGMHDAGAGIKRQLEKRESVRGR